MNDSDTSSKEKIRHNRVKLDTPEALMQAFFNYGVPPKDLENEEED